MRVRAATTIAMAALSLAGAGHAAAQPPAPVGRFGPACGLVPALTPSGRTSLASVPVAAAVARITLLTDLSRAIRAAGLSGRLNSARAITVFAPNDAAFASIGASNLHALMATRSDLVRVLEYQIVPGRVRPAQITARRPMTSLGGTKIVPAREGKGYRVDNAAIVCGNVQTANATIYITNRLIIPVR